MTEGTQEELGLEVEVEHEHGDYAEDAPEIDIEPDYDVDETDEVDEIDPDEDGV